MLVNITNISDIVFSTTAGEVLVNVFGSAFSIITPMILITVGYELSLNRRYIRDVTVAGIFRIISEAIAYLAMMALIKLLVISDKAAYYSLILLASLPSPFASSAFAADDEYTEFINMQISSYLLVTMLCTVLIIIFVNESAVLERQRYGIFLRNNL